MLLPGHRHRACVEEASRAGAIETFSRTHPRTSFLPPCLFRAIGELGPTPEALQRYQAVRQPANAAVHAASVAMFTKFHAGTESQPGSLNEMETALAGGFVQRKFAPLVGPAPAGAAAPA